MTALVVVLVVVLVVAAVGAAAVVAAQKRGFRTANEVVPGVANAAPAAWAGAHTPEARLHRRLRDAVASLRAGSGAELVVARARLEQQALAVDERLVAVAALPERVRAAPLADVASAVDAVEDAAAAIVVAGPALEAGGTDGLDALLAEVNERVALLAEARAELDGGEPGGRDG